jgi:hypothetical protein
MGDATNTFGWASGGEQSLVAPHLEYQRKNRWMIEFAGLPVGLVSAYPSAPVVLRINCSTASRPEREFEDTVVHRINGQVNLAGKPKVSPVEISFYDSLRLRHIDPDTPGAANISSPSDVIEAWSELIWQPNRGDAFGAAANYKGVAFLHMLEPIDLTPTPDDQNPVFDEPAATDAITQSWMMQGIYPKSIKYGEVAYESSDVAMVNVTFSVDRYFRVKAGTRGG